MIKIGLTTFIDIVRAPTGAAKIAALSQFKRRGTYKPAHDYWRPLRNAIKRAHQNRDPAVLERLLQEVPTGKQANYRDVVQKYKRWWGRTDYQWFDPPLNEWQHEGVTVRVNPELGLATPVWRTAVKLYFRKRERLNKLEIDVVLRLLQLTGRGKSPDPGVG